MKQYRSVMEFWKDFSTREACLEELIQLKWSKGYTCRKCGCQKSYKGKLWYYRKCADCDYDESCTAHTLFHKIKFPIEKSFTMLYLITTMKKGISTTELSRQFDISQKAAWFFKRKVQQAMGAGEDLMLQRFIEIDETLVGAERLANRAAAWERS